MGLEDFFCELFQVYTQSFPNRARRCQSLNIAAALLVRVGMCVETNLVHKLLWVNGFIEFDEYD